MAGGKDDREGASMDRRTLLKLGALAAGGATLNASCATESAAPPADGAAGSGPEPFELDEVTLAELAAGQAEGRWTARELAELYLGRIDAVDRHGPALSAVIQVDPDAPAAAASLDDERRAGRVRGPLHGIPILLKDNVDTVAPLETTAGSLALAGGVAPADAFLVGRLRAAGAVILGKANLSEWANFRSERSSSGWSGVGGQTRNPWVLDRNPCGSSSGSAAAVSANLCAVAVGTETDGSVVCPANACGVVGIKPTVGLVSRSGVVPISASQDTAGSFGRTVADAATLLDAMTGVDPGDSASVAAPWSSPLADGLDPSRARGLRVGVWRDRFGFHETVDRVLEEGLAALAAAGVELVDPVEMPSIDEIDDAEYDVLLYEFKAGIAAYLATRGPGFPHRTLADLIAFNEAHREAEMPFFEQEIFLKAQEKGPLTDAAYREARAKCLRLARAEGIDRVCREHRLAAILAPTGGPAWKTDLVNGDHFGGGCSTAAAVAGYPHVTVPAGYVHGLPVGLSFFGPAWSEPTLVGLASAFERATGARRAPGFLARAEGEGAG